ncbi:hypothetical protein [Roseateles amylovorans]|uniref:Uncharacterized protein n=1 Tax=Roseateles amylovorans TaxID=2978473 RepID=A0ABY6AYK3_9BURK|nr:hypothetical protein [Roseateles amylovorans]UXH76956.1 hypothetical protein N4261_18255 [Roseateles amylovorans]
MDPSVFAPDANTGREAKPFSPASPTLQHPPQGLRLRAVVTSLLLNHAL